MGHFLCVQYGHTNTLSLVVNSYFWLRQRFFVYSGHYGHVMVIFGNKMTMNNVLILRVNVTLWSLWSFYIYLFKKYICMYTRMYRPITAPTCCEKMTKMTITPQALLFSACYYGHLYPPKMTMVDHGLTMCLHSYISVALDMKSHDHNDHDH